MGSIGNFEELVKNLRALTLSEEEVRERLTDKYPEGTDPEIIFRQMCMKGRKRLVEYFKDPKKKKELGYEVGDEIYDRLIRPSGIYPDDFRFDSAVQSTPTVIVQDSASLKIETNLTKKDFKFSTRRGGKN